MSPTLGAFPSPGMLNANSELPSSLLLLLLREGGADLDRRASCAALLAAALSSAAFLSAAFLSAAYASAFTLASTSALRRSCSARFWGVPVRVYNLLSLIAGTASLGLAGWSSL